MRLDVLPNASATTVDSQGRLQLVDLEKVMPAWKVAVLRMFLPETWRRMRNEWAEKFMDSVQNEIYAKLAVERSTRTAARAEQPVLTIEEAGSLTLELAA